MKTLVVVGFWFSVAAGAASPLDIPQTFEKDGHKYYSCEYSTGAVGIALYEVDTPFRALAPGLEPDVCFGQVKCARQNIETGKTSWAELLMSCDANLGSTCPTAMECGARGSAVMPLANDEPRIQARGAAPASFKKGTDVYTSCDYEKQSPALFKVIKDPAAQANPSICMGLTACSGPGGLQGKGTAFCSAHLDDSCPTAMECMTRRHDFFTAFNPKPRILASRAAKDEMTTAVAGVVASIASLEKTVSDLESDSAATEKLEEAREALRKARGNEAFYKLALENWVSN